MPCACKFAITDMPPMMMGLLFWLIVAPLFFFLCASFLFVVFVTVRPWWIHNQVGTPPPTHRQFPTNSQKQSPSIRWANSDVPFQFQAFGGRLGLYKHFVQEQLLQDKSDMLFHVRFLCDIGKLSQSAQFKTKSHSNLWSPTGKVERSLKGLIVLCSHSLS